MQKLSSLSVFFPCYNEEENIPALLSQALAVLPTYAKRFEIIVVNDGSTDNTKEVVRQIAQNNPQVVMVSHMKNRGYGASLQTGIKKAKYEWTFWTDGDLQFDLNNLASFVPHAETHNAIIGYRKHRADTFIRKVNGELYTQLINILFGLRVRDIDCAFKLIQSDLLKDMKLTATGAFTSAEILIRLKEKGIQFKQVSTPHYPRKRGTPTGGSLRVIFRGIKETVQFYIQCRVLS